MPKRVIYDSPRAMSLSQYATLREHTPEAYREVFDLLLLSGCRRSEVLGDRLTSVNFDFEQGTATFYMGKTRRHKVLPLSEDLANVARSLIAKAGAGLPLITVDPDTLTKVFRKARVKARLPERLSLHSTRHSFASLLAQAGVDLTTLKSLTGHQSNQALATYLHSFDPTRKSAIERLKLPKAV